MNSLRLLIEYGAAPEDPWLQAVFHCRESVSNLLVWQAIRSGRGPVQVAIVNADVRMLKQLIAGGYLRDIYCRNERGQLTPLQLAAFASRRTMVGLLLEQGSDVNAPAHDERGVTALQAAALTGQLKIAIDLLRVGADINAKPAVIHGRTALEGASEHRRLDMAHLLMNNNHDLHKLRIDCKRLARLARSQHYSVLANNLEERARGLAERLMVEDGCEIDQLCICEIKRYSPKDWCDLCGRGLDEDVANPTDPHSERF